MPSAFSSVHFSGSQEHSWQEAKPNSRSLMKLFSISSRELKYSIVPIFMILTSVHIVREIQQKTTCRPGCSNFTSLPSVNSASTGVSMATRQTASA